MWSPSPGRSASPRLALQDRRSWAENIIVVSGRPAASITLAAAAERFYNRETRRNLLPCADDQTCAPIPDRTMTSGRPVSISRENPSDAPPEGRPDEPAELYRLLVASVRDYAIFALDPQGHVLTWNAGAAHLKGYQPHEIIGRHFSAFYPAEEVAAGKPQMELIVAARDGRFEDEGW